MRLVVIESPYAGDITNNTRYARLALRDCFDRGEAPFASHLLYTQLDVLDDSIPEERRKGINAGYGWMAEADAVVFYIDLGWSQGMLQALRAARALGKTIEQRSIHSKTLGGLEWPT